MRDLDQIVAGIEADLDERDHVREIALKEARRITRLAGDAIQRIHRGRKPGKPLDDALVRIRRLRKTLTRFPEFWRGGAVETALQEVAEAAILDRIVRGRPPPSPRGLGVTGSAYVLGLADAIGELRRLALDRLRVGDIEGATRFVEAMDGLFHALQRLHYPDAIVAVRHKQDVARGLLERTRGELAVASRGHALERKLEDLQLGR